jgi:hypothetical protein
MLNKNTKEIKNILLLVIFCLFVLFYYAYECFIKPSYGYDNFIQSVVAQNISNGNGFTILDVPLTDLSKKTFFTFLHYAPGYSLLLSIIINFFNDPASIHHLITFVFSILNLVVIYYLLKTIKPNAHRGVIYITLYFIIISNIVQGGPTDLIALHLFLLSLFAFSRIVAHSSFNFKNIFLLSFLCFLMGFFRYAYYPICFIYIVGFSILFILKKDYQFIRYALIHLILVLIMLLPQIIAKIYLTDQLYNIPSEEEFGTRGLYFHHLLYVKPIFFSFFLDDIILFRFLGYEGIGGYDRGFIVPIALRLTTLLISSCIMIWLIVFGIKKMKVLYKEKYLYQFSIILGLGVGALITISFLSALAVYYDSQNPDYIWTPAMIGRYYSIVNVMTIALFFLYISSFKKPFSWLQKAVVLIFFGAISLNTAHKLYLSTKFSFTDKNVNINLYYPPENLIQSSKQLMQKIKDDPQEHSVFLYEKKVLNPAERIMMLYVNLAGIPTKAVSEDSFVSSSKDILILSSLEEEELNKITDLKVEKINSYYSFAINQKPVYTYQMTKKINISKE